MFENITYALFWLLFVLYAICIISFIMHFIIPIKQKYIQNNLNTKKLQKEIYTDISSQIKSITDLQDLIDKQIVYEIQYYMKEYLYTKSNPYKILNLDKDSIEIATTVYNSLKPELFINMKDYSQIYKEDYWMNFIVKRTTVNILELINSGTIRTN